MKKQEFIIAILFVCIVSLFIINRAQNKLINGYELSLKLKDSIINENYKFNEKILDDLFTVDSLISKKIPGGIKYPGGFRDLVNKR